MYFSQIRVDPTNDKAVYVAGLPIGEVARRRQDVRDARRGGRQRRSGPRRSARDLDRSEEPEAPPHRQRRRLQHQLGPGQDVGLRQHDGHRARLLGRRRDMRRPYYVYIGLQDNGSWGGPSATRGRGGILNSDWFGIGGGDGFQTAVDPTDYNIVYTRIAGRQHEPLRPAPRTRSQSIRPRGRRRARPAADAAALAAGGGGGGGGRRGANVLNAGPTDAYRFNWNTPFQLSPHNPSIIWLGGNRLFKSYNRGDTWIASADLTKQHRSQHRRAHGRAGQPHACCRRTTASSPTARSSRSRNHRSCPASSGRAPTTATCR